MCWVHSASPGWNRVNWSAKIWRGDCPLLPLLFLRPCKEQPASQRALRRNVMTFNWELRRWEKNQFVASMLYHRTIRIHDRASEISFRQFDLPSWPCRQSYKWSPKQSACPPSGIPSSLPSGLLNGLLSSLLSKRSPKRSPQRSRSKLAKVHTFNCLCHSVSKSWKQFVVSSILPKNEHWDNF